MAYDESAVKAVIAPHLDAAGLDLEQVKINNAGTKSSIAVVVDSDAGPTLDELAGRLRDEIADLKNDSSAWAQAGSVTAALFLQRFTNGVPWAHLDIAGTARHSGKQKGATGRPVGLLTQYLLDREADAQVENSGD